METPQGRLALRMGGNVLEIDGNPVSGENSIMGEYPALYARMADLIRRDQSEVDLAPMVDVADAMTLGSRVVTEAFHFCDRPKMGHLVLTKAIKGLPGRVDHMSGIAQAAQCCATGPGVATGVRHAALAAPLCGRACGISYFA